MMKRIDLVKIGGFVAGEHLVTADVPVPEPAASGEVIIEVKVSAINPVDWKMAEMGFLLPETLPATLGCDVAGTVVKTSSDVKEWMGKRVATYVGASKITSKTNRGGFVQQVVSGADVLAELPESMTFADAASFPVGALTAKLLLKDLALVKDSFVLVYGASSSVGFNCVQFALLAGFRPIAVASGKNEAIIKAVGVKHFIDYRKENVVDKVKEICGSSKLNGAMDCIATEETFGTCAELVSALGDRSLPLAVSTVSPYGLPDPPERVKRIPVNLGTALEDKAQRANVRAWMPELMHLKALPIRSVKGDFTAETVQKALQINKDGVSGEKVVIQWN